MLMGRSIALRPVAERDLDELHRRVLDLAARGPHFPLPRSSYPKFRKRFEEDGFWSPDDGLFLIVDAEDRLIGLVEWEKLNASASDTEVGYWIFDSADRGRGIATEACDLLVGWLFDSQQINRVALYMHADNVASHRVAEKCGFTKDATLRESWYRDGRWHDLDLYSLTRRESDARRGR